MSASHPAPSAAARPTEVLPTIDLRERGGERDGQPQQMDRRLFMQLLVFGCPPGSQTSDGYGARLREALESAGTPGVIYADVNDPRSIALLTFTEDPSQFVTKVRAVLAIEALTSLSVRHDMTMLGRTYSTGYENDLNYWLLSRPVDTVMNDAWPWAVWYPLRRTGAFARLEPREQGAILREHGTIGRAYGEQDLAHDVRLACHGIDARDNEFVIGLVGKDLHPLSHVVQSMRKTRQTSEYISQMGPFFVGRVLGRSRPRAPSV